MKSRQFDVFEPFNVVLLCHASESLSLPQNSLWIGVVALEYFDRI